MSQFYNDVIEQKVNLLTIYLEELDSKLNVLIGSLFIDYTETGKKRTQDEFKAMFYNIYNLNYNRQEEAIIDTFEAQNDINVSELEKNLLKIYEKRYASVTHYNIEEFNKQFKQKVMELQSRSYYKYLDAIKVYNQRVRDLWTK